MKFLKKASCTTLFNYLLTIFSTDTGLMHFISQSHAKSSSFFKLLLCCHNFSSVRRVLRYFIISLRVNSYRGFLNLKKGTG